MTSKHRAVAIQAAIGVAFIAAVWWLWFNLVTNLRRTGISTDFDWLKRPAGFAVSGSGFSASQPVWEAIAVGVRNTLLVAAVGIIVALIVGVLVGVLRLSDSRFIRGVATGWVEAFRNVPVLVLIIFAFTAVTLQLPQLSEAANSGLIISNRGIWIPSIDWGWLPGLDPPVRTGTRVDGGIRLVDTYIAVTAALAIYTSTHISEIVRGSIKSVPKGQFEAASALGLSSSQRMRRVILPQAFRVAVPPLANQFLNLTKNSSLAIAIGYADVTAITNIAISQGNPAPQATAVLMLIYLVISLSISAVTNFLNRRMAVA